MNIPTEQELLGVQSQADADIILRDYPEWCMLSPEEKGTPEREIRLRSQSNLELAFLVGFILFAAFIIFGFL